MPRSFRQLRRLTWLTCLSFAVPLAVLAQTSAPASAPLSPDAQEALKKGIIAAKEQEWEIAIRSFQDARRLAPDAPAIYYNLGLAESKIPGRELRAIAWFGAYLGAATNAPNAAAVNDFIAELQIKSEGNLRRLIKTVQDAASKISNSQYDLVYLLVEAGDITAALKTAELGGEEGATQFMVASTQARTGDIVGAHKTTELMRDVSFKSVALNDIAQAQAKAGDIPAALETLATALKTAGLIQNVDGRSDRQGSIVREQQSLVEAQSKSGDITGAQRTVLFLQEIVNSLPDEGKKMNGQNLIEDATEKSNGQHSVDTYRQTVAKAQAVAGDIAGAQKTTELIQNYATKARALIDIVEAQGAAGDIVGAQKTLGSAKMIADLIQGDDPDVKRMVQATIADTPRKLPYMKTWAQWEASTKGKQTQIQPVLLATWLNKLDDTSKYDDGALNTAPFLDLASYLTSQHSANPRDLFSALKDTAEKIIKAQKLIDQMLKQQAKEHAKP
jgi:tetratricopeptide (TPR) repeat protein